ncbi:MAG TPA: hypothetical protein VK497_00355 [Candidatus Saccharimonadales bacterium]|nr:hypothetical protein [Candidatus Saccharimonadales bacterium]
MMADQAEDERARRRAAVLEQIEKNKRLNQQAKTDAERARRQQNR